MSRCSSDWGLLSPTHFLFFFSPQMPGQKKAVQPRRVRQPGPIVTIPPFNQYPIITQTFEFDGSAGTYNVTAQNLRNLKFIPTSSTTAGGSICDTFRIRSVEIWGIQSSTTVTFGDILFEWAGSSVPGVVKKSSGTSFALPHIRVVPPKNSFLSMFKAQSDTGNLFTIIASIPFTVRVSLDYTMCNGSGNPITGTALTVGTVYFNNLASGLVSTRLS